MKLLSKEQLLAALEDMIERVHADDSFEGRIEYHLRDDGAFNVEAFWRIGNSEGQGGARIIQ